jgi:hypothetical protein
MVFGILLLGGVGLFAEVVIAAMVLAAASWAVVAVLAVVALVTYARRLSAAVKSQDWGFVTDLLAVPLLAGGLSTLLSFERVNFLGMTAQHSPAPPVIAFVVASAWVAPFLGPWLLMQLQRWRRLLAYPVCFFGTYVWLYLVINWGVVSAR